MKIQYTSSALVLMLLSSAQAAIINVPGDQLTIQAAIDAASPGDEIIVAPGTYLETIDFLGKAITVRSTDPSDIAVVFSTIINGHNGGSVVTCDNGEGPDTVLNGFVIIGGSGTVIGFVTVGGGMYIVNSSPTVMNCLFSGNTSSIGGGGMYNENSSPAVSNCWFSGNTTGFGGGIFNTTSSSPTVTNCQFSGNSASSSGGGMYNEGSSSPTVSECSFRGNSTGWLGGGMYNEGLSSPTVTNCSFSENSVVNRGGGMYNKTCNPKVMNCSFSGNSAGLTGGGVYFRTGNPTVTNCILWGDSPEAIFLHLGTPIITYCNVQGGFVGIGNIDIDPLFADSLGPDGTVGTEDDDLRLVIGSPCIDAGNNGAMPVGVTTDLDGNPRFLDDPGTPDTGAGSAPFVDMGAYEFDPSCPADASGDDVVNVTDLLLLLGEWGPCPAPCPPDINNDGNVNVTDLLALLAAWGVCP